MIVLILLLKDRIEISKVKPVFGIVVRRQIHANAYLIVYVFACFIFFVVKLFFFFQDLGQSFVFVFRGLIKVVMVKNEFSLKIDIVDHFHESDGSFVFSFFNTRPFTVRS
jgi:hypothetical protein